MMPSSHSVLARMNTRARRLNCEGGENYSPGVSRKGKCSGYAGSGEEDCRFHPQLRL